VTDEEWQQAKAASKQRNVEARRAKQKCAAKRPPAEATVTWLPEPVPIRPGSRLRVLGVCSDASPETKAMYGIKV
jgi:hypothetical protein